MNPALGQMRDYINEEKSLWKRTWTFFKVVFGMLDNIDWIRPGLWPGSDSKSTFKFDFKIIIIIIFIFKLIRVNG